MIFLECKNDTKTPSVLGLLVLNVGPGLVHRGKDLGKRQQHSLISKYLSMMVYPKLFRLDKFSLTNLSDNSNSQIYKIKRPISPLLVLGVLFVKVEFLF